MSGHFPQDSFRDAYLEAYDYPSSGTRAQNRGVPTRPTLARYTAKEALGYDPFDDPIRSNTKTVLGTILKLVSDDERSIAEFTRSNSKSELQLLAEKSVYDQFPGANRILSKKHFHHVNYTGPILTAVGAVKFSINPIEAVKANLDGETKYLAEVR